MKVIIIKECKDGKVNEIIDVAAGYATNFLIKTGLAVPLNPKTKKELAKRLNNIAETNEHNLESAQKAKDILEKLELKYYLSVTNNKIHGSITRKQIIKSLREHNVHLDSKLIENIKIESLGFTKVKIQLHKDVVAELKVEVRENGK